MRVTTVDSCCLQAAVSQAASSTACCIDAGSSFCRLPEAVEIPAAPPTVTAYQQQHPTFWPYARPRRHLCMSSPRSSRTGWLRCCWQRALLQMHPTILAPPLCTMQLKRAAAGWCSACWLRVPAQVLSQGLTSGRRCTMLPVGALWAPSGCWWEPVPTCTLSPQMATAPYTWQLARSACRRHGCCSDWGPRPPSKIRRACPPSSQQLPVMPAP